MTSFDTNIVVHSANRDSLHCERAREFLSELAQKKDVVVCELMLVEVFLKLCNSKIFRDPMKPSTAAKYCLALRSNRNWQIIEAAPVMDEVWKRASTHSFAFRRIIDVRLGFTLLHHGVKRFATTNEKDFRQLGFERVWNPLA